MNTNKKFEVQLWTVFLTAIFQYFLNCHCYPFDPNGKYNLLCCIPFSDRECTVLPNCWKYRFFLERLLKVWPLYSDAVCRDRMKSMTSLFSFNPFPKSFLNIWDYWPIISPILYFVLTFFQLASREKNPYLQKCLVYSTCSVCHLVAFI